MKILIIAQEPPIRPDQVVTGNAIRTSQLTDALEHAGHAVTHAWKSRKSGSNGPGDHTFSNSDELRGLLMRSEADIYLVTYWKLMDFMPFSAPVPVILDFLAPRALELLFEEPDSLREHLRQMDIALSKTDLVLTGNDRQRQLMLLPVLQSGLDLSGGAGVLCVPLAAQATDMPMSDPRKDGWKLFSGGVDWPWRNSKAYERAIEESPAVKQGKVEFVNIAGSYVLANDKSQDKSKRPESLIPYQAYLERLRTEGHIGMDLAEKNLERETSQPFRILEFLRHGMPVITNSWLPIASDIRRYDAGWVVDSPEEVPALLDTIIDSPQEWSRKSANALKLVKAEFDLHTLVAPLIDWLSTAKKSDRLVEKPPVPAELATIPLKQSMKSLLPKIMRLIRGRISAFVERQEQKLFGGRRHRGVVIITRGDLFPTDHGAAVKIVETARGLSHWDTPVGLVTDDRKHWWLIERGKIVRKRLPLWLRILTQKHRFARINHYRKDIPLNNAFLYLPLTDHSFFWRTLYVGREVGARVIQAEFPAYAAPGVHARRILDTQLVIVEHNVEYQRIRAQVPELTAAQYERYKAIEIDLCNRCDAVICVSDNDRQILASDGVDRERLHTIPHGVDLEQFDLPAELEPRRRFEIPESASLLVYHGTFSYAPNLKALEVMATEILPRLLRKGLDVHVLAIGRDAPAAKIHPRIHFTGSVEKVGPWLKAGDLSVIPLLDGGGTRMKIIDGFAAGVPVISTSKGIEGIPVVNGEHALVIDDWEEMANAIHRLLTQPEEAENLAKKAQSLAQSMDWKAVAKRYVGLFDALAGGHD